MVNVNTVYKTVLYILNKEQRGYITPDEFNTLGTQVQREIFEAYFEELNQQLRVPQNDSEYANRVSNLQEKIDLVYQETVNILTVENNATDKTNLIRDVQRNTDHLQEIIDILSEFYEDMEDGDNEIWEDIDMINEDMGGMASHMMEIIKLQSRIAILEKTVEFTRNDGM